MIEFLIYDLKVAVLIAVFYMFYRLLLAHETFHRVNRIVLLLTAAASFVLPLCVITTHQTVVIPMPQVDVEIGSMVAEVESEPVTPLWQMVLPILFIIGMVATLANTLWSVFKILTLIRHSEQHPQTDGTTLCVTGNAELAPFSWMHYIVMNCSDYDIRDAAILAHERGHIRLHHSWDVLLVDVLTALQWFNPAIWMLRSDLRAIHEYEADGAVLSQGINARQYQYLLITKAGGIGGDSLANGITHSALKNRITMMQNNKSERSRLIKLLALVPIVGITLALNARTVTDYVYDEPQKQQPIKKGKKSGTIKMGNETIQVIGETADDRVEPTADLKIIQTEAGKQPIFIVDGVRMDEKQVKAISPDKIASISVLKDKAAIDVYGQDAKDGVVVITRKEKVNGEASHVFDVVEEMPQFPGGAPKLMEYLSQNIHYPKDAMEANKQGRVIVTFVVEKDGSISDAKVVKSVDPSLDEEALRVINTMPDWTPGKQNGEPVNTKYTVPITFRLQGKAKETPTATGSFTPTPTATGTFTPTDTIHARLVENVAVKDLVSRLPGANIDENGNITVNGKPVKKILVDGKPVKKILVDGKPVKDMSETVTPVKVKMETDDLVIMSQEK